MPEQNRKKMFLVSGVANYGAIIVTVALCALLATILIGGNLITFARLNNLL